LQQQGSLRMLSSIFKEIEPSSRPPKGVSTFEFATFQERSRYPATEALEELIRMQSSFFCQEEEPFSFVPSSVDSTLDFSTALERQEVSSLDDMLSLLVTGNKNETVRPIRGGAVQSRRNRASANSASDPMVGQRLVRSMEFYNLSQLTMLTSSAQKRVVPRRVYASCA
jgi:hypothetical protein